MYWQRQPLVIQRGDPDFYGNLLRLADVDTILTLGRPPRADIYVMKNDVRTEVGPLADLYRAYARGSTVNIKNLQRYWAPAAQLCAALDKELSHPSFVELFLTPHDAQGFLPHWDSTDGFVLHVSGRKRWKLYRGPSLTPTSNGKPPRETLGPPSHDVVLEPGDFIYLPRGWVHEAFTVEGSAMHMAVGLMVATWSDLAKASLGALADRDERWREALPPGFMGRSLGDRLAERFVGLNVDASAALEAMRETAARTRSAAPQPHFSSLARLAEISENTVLEKRLGMVCHVRSHAGRASIEFPGNSVSGPAQILPLFGFVAQIEGSFTAADLPEGLSLASRLVLLRTLVREGLLTIQA